MKPIALLFLLNFIFASLSFAEDCKVSGVSDSPQSISCTYRDGWYIKYRMEITCENGKYVHHEFTKDQEVDSGTVSIAYHEEVSSGMSPLVFKMEDRNLRITKSLGLFYRGEFFNDGSYPSGRDTFRCSLK
jgi:hypothetical protein